MIKVLPVFQELLDNSKHVSVNVTSRSLTYARNLSPFLIGPVELYGGYVSKNFENLWQFAKVYPEFADEREYPKQEYFEWAKKGWNDSFARRYPMGKNKKPLYSYWNGEKLSYIEARKRIYIPLYAKAAAKVPAFEKLKEEYKRISDSGKDMIIRDFDAFDHNLLGWTYDQVINCESKKMGHGFVLAMMLENKITF